LNGSLSWTIMSSRLPHMSAPFVATADDLGHPPDARLRLGRCAPSPERRGETEGPQAGQAISFLIAHERYHLPTPAPVSVRYGRSGRSCAPITSPIGNGCLTCGNAGGWYWDRTSDLCGVNADATTRWPVRTRGNAGQRLLFRAGERGPERFSAVRSGPVLPVFGAGALSVRTQCHRWGARNALSTARQGERGVLIRRNRCVWRADQVASAGIAMHARWRAVGLAKTPRVLDGAVMGHARPEIIWAAVADRLAKTVVLRGRPRCRCGGDRMK